MLTRARQALIRDQVHLHHQLEALLEQACLKLSSVMSDRRCVRGQRILRAWAEGQTDPETLAGLADPRWRCGSQVLRDALRGHCTAVPQWWLRPLLLRGSTVGQPIGDLHREAAQRMQPYADAIKRRIEVPGIGPEAAKEILAELGPVAAAFASSSHLASWIGVCPGMQESAGQNHSGRCAKRQPLCPPRALPNRPSRRPHPGMPPSSGFPETRRTPRLQQGRLGHRPQDHPHLEYPA